MSEMKKETFKKKFKKAFPWIVGGIGTIGAAFAGFKLGKIISDVANHDNDNSINKFLLNAVEDVKSGENFGVGVIDQDGSETYAVLNVVDKKPDWWDNAYEVTDESYFSSLVTSASTKK